VADNSADISQYNCKATLHGNVSCLQSDAAEDQWQSLTELQKSRADAIWNSEKTTHDAQYVVYASF